MQQFFYLESIVIFSSPAGEVNDKLYLGDNSIRLNTVNCSLFLWRTFPPCAVPGKVTEQNLARCFELITDEAEPDQEYPESELLIVRRPFFRTNAFLLIAHPADGGNELGVGFDLVRRWHLRKPRE